MPFVAQIRLLLRFISFSVWRFQAWSNSIFCRLINNPNFVNLCCIDWLFDIPRSRVMFKVWQWRSIFDSVSFITQWFPYPFGLVVSWRGCVANKVHCNIVDSLEPSIFGWPLCLGTTQKATETYRECYWITHHWILKSSYACVSFPYIVMCSHLYTAV